MRSALFLGCVVASVRGFFLTTPFRTSLPARQPVLSTKQWRADAEEAVSWQSGQPFDQAAPSVLRRGRVVTRVEKPGLSGAGSRCDHHRVVIIGGGTGGISVAAQLRNEGVEDIAIIEPSDKHYYQPMWTLVGGGLFEAKDSARPTASVIPRGTRWIQDRVSELFPAKSMVRTSDGRMVSYDYLVVCAGLQCDWSAIPGLVEGLGQHGICSNYHPQHAEYTWRVMKDLQSGNAVFTQPATPVKCGGAPQKIMWLTDDHLRQTGHRDSVKVTFALPQTQIFGVKAYSDTLTDIARERGINVMYRHKLVKIDGPKHTAYFQTTDGQEEELVSQPFDLLHVTPPMSSPDFLKTSPLANDCGFVDVDKETLQHTKYPNVFACGDCSSLPTSKTMAAITAQAPVLVHNLCRVMKNRRPSARYNGYTSCPIVLGYDKLLMTEFLYGGVVAESFSKLLPLPFLNQAKPQWVYLLVKKYLFPLAYWHLLMRGRWFGPKLIFKPDFSADDAQVDAADGVGGSTLSQ